jgi:ABC-type glycerol-3-phosphate transport system permease component
MATDTQTYSSYRVPFYRTRRFQNHFKTVLTYILLIVFSFVFLLPFFWMVTSALKPNAQIFIWPPQWIPNPPQWSNFSEAFSNPQLPFLTFFKNTMILEVGIIVGKLISCVVFAYVLTVSTRPEKTSGSASCWRPLCCRLPSP